MPTQLTISDLDTALLVKTTRTSPFVDCIVSAAALGGLTAVLVFRFVAKPVLALITGLAALLGFLAAQRRKTFELRVTKLEFVTRGIVGGNLGSARGVSAADIRWLEYQEDTSGPDYSHPGGLYAVLRRGSVCLLPDVDEQQTMEVIERIQARFPDVPGPSSAESPFGKHFTSLGLDEPTSFL